LVKMPLDFLKITGSMALRNSIGLVIAAALLGLAACGGSEQKEGGVTAEESKQLNEAAEMLDASPDSLTASDETGLGNGDAGSGNAVAADDAAASGSAGNSANAQ
jgi:hypothetical protein